MAEPRQTDEHAREQPEIPKKLKRRGIIAGAAALAAAALATRSTQPVGASQLVGNNGFGGAMDTNADGVQGYAVSGNAAGVFGRNNDLNGVGVLGVAPGGIGVSGASTTGPGLSGTSSSGNGVYGQSGSASGVSGVSTSGYGTYGQSNSNHGVFGTSGGGAGVFGNSANNVGVYGTSTSNHGVYGITSQAGAVAVYGAGGDSIWAGFFSGPLYATAGNNHGLQGVSSAMHGVIGTTGSNAGYAGVYAQTNQYNSYGLYAANWAGGRAAWFTGDVYITGGLTVASGYKSAAVPLPDGTHRLMYCVESPESWFEDVGQATLTNGKATVTLDGDFTATVLTANYHVFLTPYGPSNGLYVGSKSATSFIVQEQNGGTSNLTFSWRVMAKRKDITGNRLARIDPPPPIAPAQPQTLAPEFVPPGVTVPTIPKITPMGTATASASPSAPASPSATVGSGTPAPAVVKTGTPVGTATATPTSTRPGTSTGTSATPNPVATPRS